MSKATLVLGSAMLIVGFAAGTAFAKKNPTTPDLCVGKSAKDAAAALLTKAREYAGDGSWENIAVARVYYLTGQKDEGERILQATATKKNDPSDWIRVGRVYYEAGEWAKAQKAFENVLKAKPNDADWAAEIGGYYLVKGDRERAEELFKRSLASDSENMRNNLKMAGAYLGLAPHE